jgi:anti-anti-sigma regulatory factor
MIEKSEDGTLKITLASECTIADVEPITDRLRSKIGGVERVDLHVEALEEIDTAFLQLLLSLKATLDDMNVQFSISGFSNVLDETLRLYGIMKP